MWSDIAGRLYLRA